TKENSSAKDELIAWIEDYYRFVQPKYSAHLYSEAEDNATTVKEVPATYDENAEEVDGRIVLRDNFDAIFKNHPDTLIFGEDSGAIGDVNQGLEGLQEKYGETRVADAGIREATIV